jgi:tetratricopeptide (TPR) repeat protein
MTIVVRSLLLFLALLLLPAAPASAQDARGAQELADQARKAAREDRNAEAARLFQRAIDADYAMRPLVLREYADQLAFSGRAAQAVPLFGEFLRTNPAPEERARAERGLALALQWSGREADAVRAWQRILNANPADADARKNLREALIGAARAAAAKDLNAHAEYYLLRAMELVPERRNELRLEYAEQLAYADRAAEAVPLFREILSSNVSAGDRRRAERGLALALLWSGQIEEATEAWQRIAAANPNDVDARKNWREALVTAARQAASDDRNAESAALFARAIAVDPSRRMEILREYAEQLTYSGRAADAIPIYQELIATPGLDKQERQRALLGLALALSWINQLEESLAIYEQALREDPGSLDARKGRARVLGWQGNQYQSLTQFEQVLEQAPNDAEAIRGAAQAESHLGRHRDALARLQPLLAAGRDPAALAIAARASYYMGRPDQAKTYAQKTLALQPGNMPARETMVDLERDRRPVTKIEGTRSTQNDGLEIVSTNIRHSFDFNDGLTTIGVQHKLSLFDSEDYDDTTINGLGLALRHRLSNEVEINGALMLNRVSGDGDPEWEPTWDAWITFWPNDYFRVDASASRVYFDDVRSIAKNIRMDVYGLAVDYTPFHAFKLSLRGSYGWLTDGNERLFAQAEAETRLNASPEWYAGLRYTHFDFTRPALDHGYFNPDWMHSVEATMRLKARVAPYWTFSLGGSGGYEWQPDERKPIWSVMFAAMFEPSPDFALSFEVRHQDMSMAGGGSDGFSRTTIGGGLTLRW